MNTNRKTYRITLATADADTFIGACEASDWRVIDTGERVLTDDGPDGETVLLVEPLARNEQRASSPLLH